MSVNEPSRVVVAGGTGGVGEGIVAAFARGGAEVFVPSRTQERIAAMMQALPEDVRGRVHGEVVEMDEVAGIERYRDDLVSRGGPIDGVVASLGGWWQGEPLHRVSEETWRRLLDQGLGAHFRVARAFVPHLLDHPASYTFVNGFSATTPYPQASPMSVSSAAQLMLARVMAEELSATPVRVNALVLGPMMTRARTRGRPEWLSASQVGEFAVELSRSGVRGQTISLMDRAELARARERLLGTAEAAARA